VYSDVGTNFRADLGFMPRVDYRSGEVGANYAWNATATSWYSKIDLEFELNHSEDQTGILLDEEAEVHLTIQGPLESFVEVQPSHRREGYGGKEFEMNGLMSRSPSPNRDLKPGRPRRRAGRLASEGDAANLDLGLVYRGPPPRRAENLHGYGGRPGWLYRANIAQLEGTWRLVCGPSFAPSSSTSPTTTTALRDGGPRRGALQLCSRTGQPRTVVPRLLGHSRGDAGYDLTGQPSIFAKLGYAWVP
jgi:hypothetical protein